MRNVPGQSRYLLNQIADRSTQHLIPKVAASINKHFAKPEGTEADASAFLAQRDHKMSADLIIQSVATDVLNLQLADNVNESVPLTLEGIADYLRSIAEEEACEPENAIGPIADR
ncbi:MAG: hypothetical protein PHZ00_05240 [Candidatus Peribacteraceae bacterium]|nr:hypothetical protein [Candidatus Peribacteraceae bacterium]